MRRRTLLIWDDGPEPDMLVKALLRKFPEIEGRLAALQEPDAEENLGFRRTLPFATILAHELKAPLNAVDGYLQLLETSGELSEKTLHMVKRSQIRLEGMRELLKEITDMAKAELGNDVREVKDIAVASALPETDGIDLKITAKIPQDLTFRSHPGDLRLILANLLSNASKYGRKGGKVEVSISKSSDILTLKVSDDGIGLTPEELKSLKGDFVRVRNPETKDIPGSGFGLSIVRRIAAAYKGGLSIESVKGEGSVFTVTLREK